MTVEEVLLSQTLKEKGILTEEEFAEKKSSLLNRATTDF